MTGGSGAGSSPVTCTGGGAGTLASPGMAPCSINYGTVANFTGTIDTTACTTDTSPATKPWFFVDNLGVGFNFTGHIESQ
jgi:hypothetical protein